MSSIRSRHIVLGLVVALIVIFLFKLGNEDNDAPGAQSQFSTQYEDGYNSIDIEQSYSSSWSQDPSSINRHEILQSKVKGFRESTYWGEEPPLYDKAMQMNDDEFDRFIDEVKDSDADVYWGAKY